MRTEPHSTVNKNASPEINRWGGGGVGGSQNPNEESQLHSYPRTEVSSKMASSIYQIRNEEIKTLHTAPTTGVNLLSCESLSNEEAHFVRCHILEIKYQDKAQQIVSETVKAGRADSVNTIKAIRDLLQKLGTNVEDQRRKSPVSSQTTRNSD
jgi:hypothetical protein